MTGYRAGGGEIAFQPFYRMRDLGIDDPDAAFFQVRREKRLPSARENERGVRPAARSSYAGSETWIALVDTRESPYPADLHQLGISVLCTNRDLTLTMPLGRGETDFTLELEAPVAAVRCVAAPSRPLPSYAQGAVAWRLLSHLSLNHGSLVDDADGSGARAMRDLLALYAPEGDSAPRVRSMHCARFARTQSRAGCPRAARSYSGAASRSTCCSTRADSKVRARFCSARCSRASSSNTPR